MYDDQGDALIGNTFTHNGSYGNPTNGDFAELTLVGGNPINCYSGNVDTGGMLTGSPCKPPRPPTASAARSRPPMAPTPTSSTCCRRPATPRRSVQCLCPGSPGYPRVKQVVMKPLPHNLPTMPTPCKGVPANAWCSAKKHKA